MDNQEVSALVDLGSNKLRCQIFYYEDNIFKSIANIERDSNGIKNSEIINFDQALNSIRKIIAEAEKVANKNIEDIYIIFDPINSITSRLTKFKNMDGSKIEKEDVNFILRESKNEIENNSKNFKLIHMFNHKYIVDKKTFPSIPLNIYCDQLSIENIFYSVPTNILKNLTEVFKECDLKVKKYISSSYATGIYLFNEHQLDTGCCLIDLGYEKTTLALFRNSSLLRTITFPVGSNHITKDISKICYLSEIESEKIKTDFFLYKNLTGDEKDNEYLNTKYFINSKFRKISLTFLKDIMSSRINEILSLISKEINLEDNFGLIKQNIIFIGGGRKILDLMGEIKIDTQNSFFNASPTPLVQHDLKNTTLIFEATKNLLINGWPTEAVATNANKKKYPLFARIFDVFR